MEPEEIQKAYPTQPKQRRPTIPPADVNEVMREQLEYLIEYSHSISCGCRHCHYYQQARTLLLQIFA